MLWLRMVVGYLVDWWGTCQGGLAEDGLEEAVLWSRRVKRLETRGRRCRVEKELEFLTEKI